MVFYIFAFCIVAAQVLADEADVMSCLELFKPENMEKHCCEESMVMKEEFESCKDKSTEWECSNSKCFLEKLGILNGETVDDTKAANMLEKVKTEHPEGKRMAERVQNQCLGGKFEDYPPKDACPLMKFQICSYVNSIVECLSWKQNDACQKMSDNAKACKSVLDNMQQ